jgi:hypothetical protein
MSPTQCLHCHRICFTDAATCPSCGQIFQTGVLQEQAVYKEKAFTRKANALFLCALLTLLAVLLLVQLQAYLNGTGFFHQQAPAENDHKVAQATDQRSLRL